MNAARETVLSTSILDPASASARLPTTAIPRHYEIELTPDLHAATFTGTVTVDLDITDTTDSIVCNAAGLDIKDALLLTNGQGPASALDVFADNETERLTLTRRHGSSAFKPGVARLHITFSGVLNERLHGFYRSTFTDDDGNIRTLAVTQFQATDARRAFPCWDEPALKATFAISLVVESDLMAISNCRETARQRIDDRRVKVRFATTMPMSTYFVAFVIGPLEATEPVEVDGVPLRVIHRPGRGHQTAFALDVATHALRWFSDYYDIAYPSDKVDLVAIPDFAFGAMENLGCVTFREVLLLIDPDTASQAEQQRVADVINHELAHMWFGDLVTMAWWEGIWLNEAFATFMETTCSDAYRPDWRVWSTFGRARSAAFEVDALGSTRPVEYAVVTPDDAEDMFDILTYEKGASLVRMLEHYLGAETFRDGVRLYLRRHAYANTSTSDLWDALEESSGQPVRSIMDSWINQGGHPVVQARPGAHGVILTQEHFTLDPARADNRRWTIPLRLRSRNGDTEREHRVLLSAPSRILTIHPDSVVTTNAGNAGFFRNAPTPDVLGVVADQGAHAWSNSAEERHSMVDDTWALTLAGRLPVATFLDVVLGGFPAERDLNVWQALSASVSHLSRILNGTPARCFGKLILGLTSEAADSLGIDRRLEDDRARELRALLIRLRGAVAGDPATISACRKRLDHPDPAVASAALTVTARHGDADDFQRIRQRFETARDPQVEQRNLAALADFPDPDLVSSIISGTLDGTVRTQDGPYLLRRALTNPEAGTRAWTFITSHWAELNEAFPSNSVARMLGGITSLDRPGPSADVHRFLTEHPVPQGAKQIAQHLERLDVNQTFRARAATQLSKAVLTRHS